MNEVGGHSDCTSTAEDDGRLVMVDPQQYK